MTKPKDLSDGIPDGPPVRTEKETSLQSRNLKTQNSKKPKNTVFKKMRRKKAKCNKLRNLFSTETRAKASRPLVQLHLRG